MVSCAIALHAHDKSMPPRRIFYTDFDPEAGHPNHQDRNATHGLQLLDDEDPAPGVGLNPLVLAGVKNPCDRILQPTLEHESPRIGMFLSTYVSRRHRRER